MFHHGGFRLAAVNANLLLTSIAKDLYRIANALRPHLLRPFAHLVLILKKPVAAKCIGKAPGGSTGVICHNAL